MQHSLDQAKSHSLPVRNPVVLNSNIRETKIVKLGSKESICKTCLGFGFSQRIVGKLVLGSF
jgi:hypothetical protein